MKDERGTALAETALVVAMALVIVFNGLQLALIGFYQLHADAVAFTAARYVAQGGTTGGYLTAGFFPPALSLNATQAGSIVTASATATLPGLFLIPNAPASVPIQGQDIETAAGTSTSTLQPFSISESNTGLTNYYAGSAATTPSAHMICLAHTINVNGNGNGGNGAFAIFQSHADIFSKLANSFPSSVPASPSPTYDLANTSNGQNAQDPSEVTIYGKNGWDSTYSSAPICSGT